MSKAAELQTLFAEGGLQAMFIEGLGWSAPLGQDRFIGVDDEPVTTKPITNLKGFQVFSVEAQSRPTRKFMRGVDAELGKIAPERLEVFQSPKAWFWHWPKRTNSGTVAFEAIETLPHSLPLFLAQRLSGLAFTADDHKKGFTISDVRNRVQGNFDATNVTKKFYDRFQKEHVGLANAITGIPEAAKSDYSTTLLNRLMFLYFLQKKQFLNDDPQYLENTLRAVQALEGKDRFYSFYRDALLPLFFEKLNDREGIIADPEIVNIIGDVPYVNGGLFARNELEEEYFEALAVPDQAFEKIFGFFSEFNWHLDTRPTGNPNEINPEVIGYIFEQYINFTASGKKANGAYYTPHDVTAYMVGQTLVPRIMDDFAHLEKLFALLKANPDRYIQPMMLHGWDAGNAAWIDAPSELERTWLADPIEWPALDAAKSDAEICLPGETWVEMFHRRERVADLREKISSGEISTVNDLITFNLNAQLLLTDAIDALSSDEEIHALFDKVSALTVFDPTCGSGAFLFAALEVLEDVYAHIIDAARAVTPDASKGIVALADEQPSTRYFIRKHCAIRNLYGTDLMPGAIETAKLRIFLALASCIDHRDQLQPLPDLDFNLKCGNLVVGFKDAEDVDRFDGDLLAQSHLESLAPRIDNFVKLYSDFVEAVEEDGADQAALKKQLKSVEETLRAECDRIYSDLSKIDANHFEAWLESARPFHWFCEFPEIMRGGGFDVVIGNPPYLRMSKLPGYTVTGYVTQRCPDLYAVCHERSLQLLSPTGRHAFVVMLNLAFSDDYAALRELIAEGQFSEWWSTFGKRPDSLFRGVQVRNTVLILGPGSKKFSSKHNIFTQQSRSHLFQSIELDMFDRYAGKPPLRAGVANSLLRNLPRGLSNYGPPSDAEIFCRPTGRYWFPVLFSRPSVLDLQANVKLEADPSVRSIQLTAAEPADLVGACLAGKIGYLAWSAFGDDFHVNADEADIPRALVSSIQPTEKLFELSAAVKAAGEQTAFVSANNDGYINVRWNAVRAVTDQFDRELLKIAGLLEFWRPLNIWYRQCMRATRENTNSRRLSPEEIQQHLNW